MKLATRQSKGTDIPWQQTVPTDWAVVRIKYVLEEKKSLLAPDLPCGAISFGSVVYKDGERIPEETRATYQEVLAGEFLVNPINLNYDLKSLRTALADIDVCVSPAYIVLRLTGQAHRPFLRYLLHQFDVAHMKTLGAGVRQTITFADIGNCYCGLPPFSDQVALAGLLDREISRIDALIEKKTRFIELLREKRQALITRAVTRGLDPSVLMKDSRVELLGPVPEHYQVQPLMHLTAFGRDIQYGIVLPGPDVGEGIPIVKGGNVKPHRLRLDQLARTTAEIEAPYARARLRPNDLVYSIRGSIGDAELVPDELNDANITQDVARISVGSRANPRWLLYVMKSSGVFAQLDSQATGATIRGINIAALKRVMVPVPPISEQVSIAEYLDKQMAGLDRLMSATAKSLELLSERRAALITAAVTGQIDVRAETPEDQLEPA